jgi:sterol desaturase/sphingolipid hydroxylase (fatty acid hydroxylase superfamily)
MELGLVIIRDAASRVVGTAPFLFILVAWELAMPLKRYPLRARLKGLQFWIVTVTSASVCLTLFPLAWQALGLRPFFALKFDQWFAWAGPLDMTLAAIAALFVGDFFSYWFHRAQHTPLLWRFHAVHHSIEEMHAVSSYGHPADEIFRTLMVVFPMSFVPVTGVVEPILITAFALLLPTYTHSPVKFNFGPLRHVLVDNRFHRIHHSIQPEHFDKNFATYFTIWDRVFGTAVFPKKDEWPDVGLAHAREPANLWEWINLPIRYGR